MKKSIFGLILAFSSAAFSLPDDARRAEAEKEAREIVMKMTVKERLTQLWMSSCEIPRLGIRHREWWNEALHGVARAGLATVFPQSIGAAATFDPELELRMSKIIAIEGRAKRNLFAKTGHKDRYLDLTYWSPNVNMVRDPRWGRGQETFGEDPYLSSVMGVAFVKGLQGDDPKFLKAAGCAKHYAVHSGPENLRHRFNAVVSKRDLVEYYLPAFKALAVDAKVEAFMGAYSALNGIPCCANKYLLTDVLRGEWGFKGHIVSDVGAVEDVFSGHRYTKTYLEASAKCTKAGLDLYSEWTFRCADGVLDYLSEKEVTEALVRLYTTRVLLGEFDKTPWDHYGVESIATPEHRAVALEMAEKSLVLIKNNGALPFSPEEGPIAVSGALAASELPMRGNYNGQAAAPVSVIAAVTAEAGYAVQVTDEWGDGDTVIYCVGITSEEEGEEGCGSDNKSGDRVQYGISKSQLDGLKKCRKSGRLKRLVAIVFGGSPVDLKPIEEVADAVIFAWYPGEAGGKAIARTLFGKSNPSGRLPVTFPKSYEDLPDFTDYSLSGRTYRYATKEPAYPFGYGLSYTTFAYSDIKTARLPDGGFRVTAKVTNTGKVAGEEVSQLYLRAPASSGDRRKHHLEGFKRISLKPGESGEVAFDLTREQFQVFDEEGTAFVPSTTTVFVGGGQPGFSDTVSALIKLDK
jgi:beta-glucosidase